MGALFQPINQVKFTNVAIVKYKHKGKKFEIACYKNKIIDWRNGIELNIDDVLQSHLIFTNVSKGEIAKKSELNSCFHSDDNYEICKTILEKGTLQISNKERSIIKDKIYKDMIEILHEMSVNPQTGYPLSTNMIESMVKNIGYSINIDDSAKKQALKVFDMLSKEYDDVIQRAFMRIQIICDDYIKEDVIKFLNSNNVIIEEEKITNNLKREDNVDAESRHMHDEVVHLPKNEVGGNGTCGIITERKENDTVSDSGKEEFEEKAKIMSDSLDADSAGNNVRVKVVDEEEEKYSHKNLGDNNANNREDRNNDACSTHQSSDNKDTPIEDTPPPKSNKGRNEDDAEDETSYVISQNNINAQEKSESISKKEIKDLLHSTTHEDERKNKTGEFCPQKDEKAEVDPLTDDIKVKTKQKKNKHEKERKEKNTEMHKIVFLCYPCVYRCVDAFTKKYKKSCSSKILNNNVKIATSNKKKNNNAENSVTATKVDANDAMGKTSKDKDDHQTGGDNLNGGTCSKGNRRRGKAKGNSRREEEVNQKATNTENAGEMCSTEPSQTNKCTSRNDKDKVIQDRGNYNSCNSSKNEDTPNAIQQKSKEQPSDKPKSESVIMCTSCLTKIEKKQLQATLQK